MTHDTTSPPIGLMALYRSTNAGSVVGASGRSSVITKNCGQRNADAAQPGHGLSSGSCIRKVCQTVCQELPQHTC